MMFFPMSGIIILGCASSGGPLPVPTQVQTVPRERAFINPPGIDTTLAKNAFIEARDLFISIDDEKAAQDKYETGRQEYGIFQALQHFISMDDSLRTESYVIERLETLELDPGMKRDIRSTVTSHGVQEGMRSVEAGNQERLIRIMHLYEEGLELDPHDIRLMWELAQCYHELGKQSSGRSDGSDYLTMAIDVLHRALNLDLSNHSIYYRLGQYQFHSENWEAACENFRKALEMLRTYSFLPVNLQDESYENTVDSSLAFAYVTGIIQSYIKRRDSQNALIAVDEAEIFVQTPTHREFLKDTRQLISWAEGNILARELFVEATDLRVRKDFLGASEKYHEVLHQTGDTARKAYLETAYTLSLVEYQELLKDREYLKVHRPETIGLNRLRSVIQAIPKDIYGVPRDSSYMDYFHNYGAMLFREGTEAVEAQNRREALALFQQGAILHSSYQARCCLELIKLTRHRGPMGLRWALKTYSLKDRLSEEGIIELYRLLRFVTKRCNNSVLCSYFNEEYRFHITNASIDLGLKNQIMVYEFFRSGYSCLDAYFTERFAIRLNPVLQETYESKFKDAVRRLPANRREILIREITDVYKKIGDEALRRDWEAYLQRL